MGGEALLEALEPAIVDSLDELVDESCGGDEADLPALLAGGEAEPQDDVIVYRGRKRFFCPMRRCGGG